MRRLALLVAGGALWLLAAAVPVLADGGPRISTINNGSGGLTADTCAGCHRAHTAQGAMLLKEEGTALCTSCHGSARNRRQRPTWADGVQYRLATGGNTGQRGAEARRPPGRRRPTAPDRFELPVQDAPVDLGDPGHRVRAREFRSRPSRGPGFRGHVGAHVTDVVRTGGRLGQRRGGTA